MATTDFPSLAVSLSMLAAPYQEAATFSESSEPVMPADFVLTEEKVPFEDEFVVDSQGEATEVAFAGSEVEDVVGFAAEATDGSGDLLEDDIALFASSTTDDSGGPSDEQPPAMSVPMPEPPTTEIQVTGPPAHVVPNVAATGEPIYTPDSISEPPVAVDADLQPLIPHGDSDEGEEEEQAPTVDPNIAAIVFPKTPETTSAPVPSVAGFDPSRYFNFDDSGTVEDNLEAGSEFGVPQRAASSPEALRALKELSAFRDR